MNLRPYLTSLARGLVVAIPTDTVYGLAASLEKASALFAVKGRPPTQPILVLAADQTHIEPYLDAPPPRFFELAKAHWPGPLTLVVPVKSDCLPPEVQQEGACGFRIPNHPLALQLLEQTGPLAVTSANRSGGKPATSAEEARAIFGKDLPVLDGGVANGKPSTILKWTEGEWICLRQGSVAV